ncbi:MAG: type II secretion system F family protein [Candidatus Nitrosocaldus sp.]
MISRMGKRINGNDNGMDNSMDNRNAIPLEGVAYMIFGTITSISIPSLEKSIKLAMMRVHPSAYISYMLFMSILVSVISSIVLLFSSRIITAYISPYIFVAIPLYLFSLTFIILYIYPYLKANDRMNKIEQQLGSKISIMAILSTTGMRLEEIIANIARGSDQFSRDMSWIISKMEHGIDLITALTMLKDRSNGYYRKFLTGLVDAYRIGSVTEYLLNTTDIIMNERKNKIQKSTESMNVFGEMYIITMIVFPMLILIMLIILGMLNFDLGGGLSVIDITRLIVYLVVPIIGIMMIILADSIIGKISK